MLAASTLLLLLFGWVYKVSCYQISPINILKNRTVASDGTTIAFEYPTDIALNKLILSIDRDPLKGFLVNFGGKKNARLTIWTPFLPDSGLYVLRQIHAHWGNNIRDFGSEHFINGVPYTGEFHIVHVHEKYTSIDEAMKTLDGLAIIAVFIQVDPDTQSGHPAFDSFKKLLNSKKSLTDEKDLFHPDSLFPENRAFYSYYGSMTGPEEWNYRAQWMVMEAPLKVAVEDMEILYKMHSANYYNKTAAIQNDTVITYHPILSSPHRSTIIIVALALIIFCVVAVLLCLRLKPLNRYNPVAVISNYQRQSS